VLLKRLPLNNPVKELTLEQVGIVEVTSVSKPPEEVWKTPAAIYVITQEDIQRSGVTSIPDALRLAPGVEVARIDSVKYAIGIRGFGSRTSRDVLVLIDGRTVYTTLFAGTYWETQNVLLEDVDRIEIISPTWGNNLGAQCRKWSHQHHYQEQQRCPRCIAQYGRWQCWRGVFSTRYGGGNGKINYRIYSLGFDRGPEYHTDSHNFDRWRSKTLHRPIIFCLPISGTVSWVQPRASS
jgi:iron complex outermembrane recepter protein